MVRNCLGQGALVVKHLNPHKHSSGSDFPLRKDTSSSLSAVGFSTLSGMPADLSRNIFNKGKNVRNVMFLYSHKEIIGI